jgi:hypothetical protein
VLRDPVGPLFVGAVLVAAAVTLSVRHGIEVLYDQSVADVFDAAQPSLSAVAAAVDPAPATTSDLRLRLGDAAHDGAEALAPIVRTSRLRGTFLEDADATAYQQAQAVAGELAELDGALHEPASLTQIAYRTERVFARVPEAGGRLQIGSDVRAHADELWARAYARDLRAIDADFGGTLAELEGWRQGELPALAAANRWGDAQRRVGEFRAEVERMADRVRSLPTPPAALEPARDYLATLRRVDRALAALDDYAAKAGAAPTALQDSADQVAAFRAERRAPLAAIAQLGG